MVSAKPADKKSPDVKTPGDFVKALISSNTKLNQSFAKSVFQHYPISGIFRACPIQYLRTA